MEVEHQQPIMHDSAVRDVSIAQEHVPAGMRAGVSADPLHHVAPVDVVRIAVVHERDLPEMDRLNADVDVAPTEVHKPHPRLRLAHIGHGRSAPPLVDAMAVGIEHRLVAEVPWFRVKAKLFEQTNGHGDSVDLLGDDLERGASER